MSRARIILNALARSKGLLGRHDLTNLLQSSARWLVPLGVNIIYLLELYRAKRPKFLNEMIR
jgi:hypothetical protein